MIRAARVFLQLLNQRKFAYISIAVFHVLLIGIVFHSHFAHPTQTVFSGFGDGLKNNFTLYSYIKEPIGKDGLLKYNSMDYPYGDYIYTTDNTPLFSIPFKWFCHHIWDLSDYSLAIFNFVILSNILLCGLLVFFVFKRLTGNALLSWLLALFLPWTNFQLTRLFNNNYNLSLTSFNLIAIVLFMLWLQKDISPKRRIVLCFTMCLFSVACFLAHGYYVAIIPVFLGAMLFFAGLKNIKQAQGRLSMVMALMVPAITGLLILLLMKTTDGYLSIRQDFAEGYDWMEQKANISMMFTHYSFHRIIFPAFIDKYSDASELMIYMGNIGLYAVTILFVISLFHRPFRLTLLSIQRSFFANPVTFGIFFGGLLMLSMALGENYYPLQNKLYFGSPLSLKEPVPLMEMLLMVLMGLIILIALFNIFSQKERLSLIKPNDKNNTVKGIRIGAFYLLCFAAVYLVVGKYSIGHNDPVVNVTNPLWWLHKFTRKVEQFRSMVRFAWPFYWSFYIWVAYTLAGVYQKCMPNGKLLMIAMVTLLGAEETINFGQHIATYVNQENALVKPVLNDAKGIKNTFEQYQAILPIPYYHVGTENYDYTINDNGEWSQFSYQLSLQSKLPLMSCKLSRTPPPFAIDLLKWIATDSMSTSLKSLLNDKPILVAIDRKFMVDSTAEGIPDKVLHPIAYKDYWLAFTLPERNHLTPVDSIGSVYFYKWYPQK